MTTILNGATWACMDSGKTQTNRGDEPPRGCFLLTLVDRIAIIGSYESMGIVVRAPPVSYALTLLNWLGRPFLTSCARLARKALQSSSRAKMATPSNPWAFTMSQITSRDRSEEYFF